MALTHYIYKYILAGMRQCTWNFNGCVGGTISRVRVGCHFEVTHDPKTSSGSAWDMTMRLAQVVLPSHL